MSGNDTVCMDVSYRCEGLGLGPLLFEDGGTVIALIIEGYRHTKVVDRGWGSRCIR
eukprot:gene19630-biopygen6207